MTSIWVGEHGWTYLIAIIDCCTRDLVAWHLSVRCRAEEAITLVEEAAAADGIQEGELTLGSDNGSALTARRFKARLAEQGIRHRRGGYRDPESASTGWETFLGAVIQAGLAVTGTWPMRTELGNRMRAMGSNALASSILLVCRPRPVGAASATRREFVDGLRSELPGAVRRMQSGNVAPVDLAQAAIGPGMAVFTRYARVLDAAGGTVSVREALVLINQVLDEVLAEQEGDFDADSRWALSWFEQLGFGEGEFGVAETLSKAKNTSVAGMVEAGILASRGGKVRLLRPDELSVGWDPAADSRLTAWEMVHHLVRVLEADGEGAAAGLVGRLGAGAGLARELAYRLYTVCERKKRAAEALSYNGLVQSWPELERLAGEPPGVSEQQTLGV